MFDDGMKCRSLAGRRTAVLTALFFTSLTTALSAAEISTSPPITLNGEYRLIGALHRTGGAGDKTLMRDGDFFTHELKLDIDSILNDEWRFDTHLHLRQTQDPQIETRGSVHLLGWISELYNREWRFTGGDFYGDFSKYTLSQALRGAQIHFKNETVEAKAVAGYSQRQDDDSFFRYVTGGRIEALIARQWGFVRDLRVGSNFTAVEDDAGSFTGGSTSVMDASNRVGSVNFSGTFWNANEVNGEIAQAWIDEDTTEHSSVDRKIGTALRLNSLTRFSKMTKMRLGYEWVQAQFGTLAGSAVPDRITYNGRLDHKFNRYWASEASYRLTYDKLEESILNKRTITQTPHLALNWTPASENWWWKDYYMRFFWDNRTRRSENDPSGQVDFMSNDYGVENEFSIEKLNFTSGYTYRAENDDLNRENYLWTQSAYIGVRTRGQIGQTKIIPSLRYAGDYTRQEKIESTDFTQTVTLGLVLEPSERLRFDSRISMSLAERELADSDSLKTNVYLGAEYRLPTPQDLTLKARYEHLNYAHGQATQSFSEHNLQTELVWRF